MRERYASDRARFARQLERYESTFGPLEGIVAPTAREALIEQLIDSEQRVVYTDRLVSRGVDPASADPRDPSFDPLRAALIHKATGDFDEAVWLVFLFVHFGKHRVAGWRYVRAIYGQLGGADLWTWAAVSSDITSFRFWLDENIGAIRSAPGPQGFGNHHKYESLDAWSDNGTGSVFESYVDWIHESGGEHAERFNSFSRSDPEVKFDEAYQSMSAVRRFGRTARFDYLTMLAKLALVDMRPPHAYIVGATGPLRGARLLFNGDRTVGAPLALQNEFAELARTTGIAPNILEDAVCNWQKSPEHYKRFSG